MFVNLIFNIVLYNFTIQLRDFYLNKNFTQFLDVNQDNLAIVTLFSIHFLFLLFYSCMRLQLAILFKLINSNFIIYAIS